MWARGRGRLPAGPQCCSWLMGLVDRHSGRWRTRNVAKWPGGLQGERDRGSARPIGPQTTGREITVPLVRHRWTTRCCGGRIGTQNRGQQPGLGAVAQLKMQMWSAMGDAIADRPRDAEYGRPQACRRMQLDDWQKSQCSCSL